MSGPVCPVCGGPWHAVCPAKGTTPELAWRALCGLLELAVIMTVIIIVGTLIA